MTARVVLVPGVLALLPEYAGLTDPVPELRAACLAAVGTLGAQVEVVADAQGARVARALLDATPGRAGDPADDRASYLVVGNGSARRHDAAPGYVDERAVPFDDAIGAALRGADRAALRAIDHDLGRELWATTEPLARLADLLPPDPVATVRYDADPFGVQYWVVEWESREE